MVADFLELVIGFCGGFLHDDGALLLFYPDNHLIKKELSRFFNNNNLMEKGEWTVINSLHLCHPLDSSKFVSSYFKSSLLFLIVIFHNYLLILINPLFADIEIEGHRPCPLSSYFS